jgi:hypothetical protein
MNEELEQLLKNLRLKRLLEIYEEHLAAADKQDISYTEFFVRLMKPSLSPGNPASIAARFVPSPNWSLSRRLRTSFSSAIPVSGRPDSVAESC